MCIRGGVQEFRSCGRDAEHGGSEDGISPLAASVVQKRL
jgi:hypothetical protein